MSYDSLPIVETIDLIRSLPMGSLYRGSINKRDAWTLGQYRTADILDFLMVINWRLMGCPEEYIPVSVTRPGDADKKAKSAAKRNSIKKIIENTTWEEV